MKLLIVDDEVLAIQGLVDDVPWDELQFDEIFTATSYAQAVNLLRTKEIDVLLCDIEMPLRSGLDLVKWVKEQKSDIQCIFLTCHDSFAFAKRAIELECVGYVLKPADTYEVVEVLRKAERKVKDVLSRKKLESGNGLVEEIPEEGRIYPRDAINRVESYIRLHLAEHISVEQLAMTANMSVTHLSRLFKKKHDMTLVDYITEQRMKLAMELLKKEDIAVGTVAAMVGYHNYSYFTKAFKRYTDKTPREYRQDAGIAGRGQE